MKDAGSRAGPAQTSAAALDELFKPANRSDAPGLVVGIALGGQIVYRRGFGLASVELGVANTPRTRMRIGSTSKHFTSLAALLLAEDGKLDIDTGVRTYLPELPLLAGEPTLRQLMHHTGGYRCYLDLSFLADGLAIKPPGSALASQIRQSGVNFPPGERMIYCNSGYHLLSLVIERAAGLPFERFLKQRILDPLGMVDTESVPSDLDIRPGMATLHIALPDGRYRRGIFPSEEIRGEGGLVSTVDDMLRWLAHLRGAKIVGSAASWARMLEPACLNNGTIVPYALGLMRETYRGVELIHHAGGVMGGSCQMLTAPAHGLDIVIITNGAPFDPVEAARKIVDIVLGEQLAPPDARAASAHYRPLVGKRYYSPASGLVMGFSDLDGQFALSVLNRKPVALHARGDRLELAFVDVGGGPYVVHTAPLAADAAAPAALAIGEGGNADRYELLPETAPALAEVAPALIGQYRGPDLGACVRVFPMGAHLLAQMTGAAGSAVVRLDPYSNDVLGVDVPGSPMPFTGAVSVVRDGAKVTHLRVTTPRTRQLMLVRESD